mmetsp:Transcript_22359/g.40111  ORF Transcript_22359/g.40111 Transcript_22359/m.40111 type:complete len:911 (-) Transcript_22359:158-2890(-)
MKQQTSHRRLILLSTIGIGVTLSLVTPPPVAAFEVPRQQIIRPITTSTPIILHATTNGSNENDPEEKDDNNTSPTRWANAAYSGLSNAWGYSSSVVDDRSRRKYERRRIRHRLRMVEGKRPAEKGTIGAADAFMGNLNMENDDDVNDGESNGESTAFDDNEMDEDGYYGMLGGKKRGFLRRLVRQMWRVPYGALFEKYRKVEPGTLILVRHGESLWNANKTFTGWADPDLSPQGYREVEHAARLLLEGGYKVDVVFTSRLKRAIRSSFLLLQEFNEVYLPVFKSWRLNERMYGALTGLSKTETAERLGAELVQEWRGSLRSRPPALTPADKYYPGRDRRHADLGPAQLPLTESLLDCMERTKPVWLDKISYEIACGKNVLVVAHANTLRGLVKIIDNIGDDEIQDIAIPTGIPLVYNFDSNLNPIPPSSDQKTVTQKHMTGIFLEKPGLLKQAIKREVEWCSNVPDYEKVMSRSTTAAMTPLQRSLSKLEAERQVQTYAAQFVDEAADEEEDDGSDGKLTLVEQDEDKVWAKGLKEIEDGEYLDPDHPDFKEEVVKQEGTLIEEEEEELTAQMYMSPCVTAMPAAMSVPGIGPVPVRREALIVMIRHGKTENNKLGLFTGWEDVPLAVDGVVEAKEAGKLLKLHGFEFDAVYTSWLSRAIETAWYVMDEMDCLWLPIIKSWRLNERMYGDLTGLSKNMVKQRHGEKQFMAWRRGYAVNPPPVSSFSPQYPGNDIRYRKYLKDVRISVSETLIRSIESKKFSLHRKLPKSESLKDCMDRTIPYFTEQIMPEAIDKGKRVLIASSENAIRGLLMHLCEIPEDKIAGLEIPNGLPLIFDMNSKCIKLLDDGSGEDPLEKYNFGPSASYLFRPCKNPDGSEDDSCDITFSDVPVLSATDSELIESIRKPVGANV